MFDRYILHYLSLLHFFDNRLHIQDQGIPYDMKRIIEALKKSKFRLQSLNDISQLP